MPCGETTGLDWVVGAVTGATGAGVCWPGREVDGQEDGDKFGWSAMERRAALACLARGERRGRIRAREASMLKSKSRELQKRTSE